MTEKQATERKQRTITLTDRAPVKVYEDEWPVLANASYEDYDNKYRFQANRTTDISIRVRQHADGRAIVYAVYNYSTKFQNERDRDLKFGELLEPGADLAASIRNVGRQLADRLDDDAPHVWDLINECIADLPAQTL